MLSSNTDDKVADAGFDIVGRSHGRELKWNDGVLALSMTSGDSDRWHVLFNFELKSSDSNKLLDWINRPISEFVATVNRLEEQLSLADEVEVLIE